MTLLLKIKIRTENNKYEQTLVKTIKHKNIEDKYINICGVYRSFIRVTAVNEYMYEIILKEIVFSDKDDYLNMYYKMKVNRWVDE